MRVIDKDDKCEYPKCKRKSRVLVQDESKEEVVGKYCIEHGREVLGARSPEYTTTCPNCGCKIPIN